MSMKIYVTNKACPGCPFTPDRLWSDEETRVFTEQCLHDEGTGHVPDCLSVTVARYKRGWELPFPEETIVCCFAFFYCYGRQQIFLREAIEQGLIEYVDITGWESFEESGLYFAGTPKWQKGPQSVETALWLNKVCAKYGITP